MGERIYEKLASLILSARDCWKLAQCSHLFIMVSRWSSSLTSCDFCLSDLKSGF